MAEHGARLVPCELGSEAAGTWREATMSLRQFMETQMAPSLQACLQQQGSRESSTRTSQQAVLGTGSERGPVADGSDAAQERQAAQGSRQQQGATGSSVAAQPDTGYIAQHPLFNQLPSLLEDFAPPAFSPQPELMNAWIGTADTITPLHFDSYDNLLCQIAGFKYVRLYDRGQSHLLYVVRQQAGLKGRHAQSNISAVNIEHPDIEQHPHFADAEYLEAIMGPGDMLFIPAKHWHYVRSLTPSVSVNMWF